MRKISLISILCLSLAVWALPAEAHHIWLNATRYNLEEVTPDSKAKTIIYLGWGDYFPLHDFLREGQMKNFSLKTPGGKDQSIELGQGGFNATPVELSENGTHIFSASLGPKFVADIWKDGKMQVILESKDKLPKDAKILESKYGYQFAKALVHVGTDSGKEAFSKPIGQELEIVPLVNPQTLREGDYLPFQILFKGEPLRAPFADPIIKATYVGFSTQKDVFASTVELDKKGMCKLKLIHYGVWQIVAEYSLEPTPELADKVDKIEYKASLTFEIR